ncbi:response regulator, partial [bacterium]|nr:response regulator [bacterium]
DVCKNFLIINSYHYGYIGSDALLDSARQTLLDKYPDSNVYVEYMDTKRFQDTELSSRFHDYFKIKYANLHFDAFIVADDNAFQFSLLHYDDFFNTAPVVFCGVNDFDPSMIEDYPNYTGVLEFLDIQPTLDLALHLHPFTKTVEVISDGTETGLAQRKQIEAVSEHYSNLTFQYLNGEVLLMDRLLERLKTLPDDAIVLAAVWTQDQSGQFIRTEEFYQQITEASVAPVYGFDRLFLGHGIVGGKLNWGGTQGEYAAKTTIRLLETKVSPKSVPVYKESLNAWMFDYAQLLRLDIKDYMLPANSIIINQPDPFFKIDKTLFFMSIAFLGITVGLMIVIIITLDQRKRAETKRANSEQKFRMFIERIQGITYQFEASTKSPLIFDGNVEGITGYKADDFIQQKVKWDDLICSDDLQTVLNARKATQTNHQLINVEYHITHKDGTKRRITESCQCIEDVAGRPCVLQGMFHDITDVYQLREQLTQTQKMEAIGQLAGGVAHDFNNILMAIFGYVDLILNEAKKEALIYNNALQVQKAAHRAESLTRQLLAFSRKQILQPKVVQLNQLLRDIEKMLFRLIQADIDLQFKLDPDLPMIYCDHGQIEQVVMNLVVNARDAMPDGGKLTVETKNVFLDESYVKYHAGVSVGQYAMIAVSDTGTGMTKDIQAHIFEPFFSTKEKGKGTGLGLSTVHGVVKQSNGHIWVYSEPGKGATFKVYFHATDKAPVEALNREQPPELYFGNETILVVEDDESVRELVVNILTKYGYNVLEAEDGQAATIQCELKKFDIHLLLTDVVMPFVSGKKLAEFLKTNNPDAHIIFMSGYTENAIVHHGELDADVTYIQKPIAPTELVKKIRTLLDVKPSS